MKKYENENNELGIIKAGGYSTEYLNRQYHFSKALKWKRILR